MVDDAVPSLVPSARPPNRQSPILLTPPVRPSGRLDERAALVRPAPPPQAPPSAATLGPVIWVLVTATVVAAAVYFGLPWVLG